MITANLARLALPQMGVAEAFDVLAYCEGFTIIAGGLGVHLAPLVIARQALTAVIDGPHGWEPSADTFSARLKACALEAITARVSAEQRERATKVDAGLQSLRMGAAQIGDVAGVVAWAHHAAELMRFQRVRDRALVAASVSFTRYARRRLAAIAPNADDAVPVRALEMGRVFATARVAVPSALDDEPTNPRAALALVFNDDTTPAERT